MRQTIKSIPLFICAIIFCGCGTYKLHVNPEPRYLENKSIPNISNPVAIKNVSVNAEGVLCGFGTIRVVGNLYNFTEASINIVKDVFNKNNIKVDDKANKVLLLAVDNVTCDRKWNFITSTTLIVKTGKGLEKKYKDSDTHMTGYQTTPGFELAISRCVEQMLNDKDILTYLAE